MEFDNKKLFAIGAVGVVGIVLLSRLSGKSSGGSSTEIVGTGSTGQIANLSGNTDPNTRYQIAAEENLGLQAGRLQGLQALLDYSNTGKDIDSQERMRALELNTTAQINSQSIERDLKVAQLASSTELGVAGIQAGVEQAAIASQVQIAGIAADTQKSQIAADLQLGMRGYDSADLATRSQTQVSLAGIDLQRFGITTQADVDKYLADIGLKTRKKELRTDRFIASTEANRDITIGQQQSQTAIQVAKIQKPSWWQSLLGSLGPIGDIVGGFV